jgi:transcriptional regulator with XRE-family HTH domain
MPQDALAKRAGVSPGCLRGFENGTRRTTRVKLERIAAACGMTFDILTASATAPPPAAADPVQTDETAAIACLFGWAHTGARMRVIAVLREHYAQRTDPNPAPVAFALGFIAGLRPSTTIAEPVPAGDPVTLATVIGQLATITDAATLREILAVIARDSVRVG